MILIQGVTQGKFALTRSSDVYLYCQQAVHWYVSQGLRLAYDGAVLPRVWERLNDAQRAEADRHLAELL